MSGKICVFGASGATGSSLIQLAVQRGIIVTAFVRNEAAQSKFTREVKLFVGNLLDPDDVINAIAGCHAVICTIGPRAKSPEVFCASATRNIIEAMKTQNVSRLLCQTGAMIGDYPHLSWFMRRMKSSYQKKHPDLAMDRAEQEKLVLASGLDWTLIKPPRLTNGKFRGNIRSGEDLKVGMMSSISRLDLSHFILDQLDSSEFLSKRVIVQYN